MAIDHLPQNLYRIRKSRDLNMEPLADLIGLSRIAYSNLENGKSQPKSSTLAALSKALQTDINDLLSDPPEFTSLRFRSNKILNKTQENMRKQLLYDVHRWLQDYNELSSLLGYSKPEQLKVRSSDPVKAAAEFRKFLNLDADEPVLDIIGLLEKYGIRFYLKESKLNKFFGFSVGPVDGGPAIVVNTEKGISIERQIFTVAHELAHLLLHRSSFKPEEVSEIDTEEKEADRFAGHFLLPQCGFNRELNESKGLHWIDAVLHIKRKFRVSYKTILHRIIENERIPAKDLHPEFSVEMKKRYKISLKNHYEPYPIEEEIGQEPVPLDSADFVEDKLSRLVREAYEKEEISLSRAAEILRLSVSDMRRLINNWKLCR
jgi:Zn-dependent peptidase ImmA (M78 family)/DNA-binding XRE family transcriptional regulator